MQVRVHKEAVVDAPRAAVWRAWTTSEGVPTFFGERAVVELALGGRYEIFWDSDPDLPAGAKGSEGCRVLSFLDEEMLSFDWSAPPSFPAERAGAKTFVVVRFADAPGGKTRVTLDHAGWPQRLTGRSEDVFHYFRARVGHGDVLVRAPLLDGDPDRLEEPAAPLSHVPGRVDASMRSRV